MLYNEFEFRYSILDDFTNGTYLFYVIDMVKNGMNFELKYNNLCCNREQQNFTLGLLKIRQQPLSIG